MQPTANNVPTDDAAMRRPSFSAFLAQRINDVLKREQRESTRAPAELTPSPAAASFERTTSLSSYNPLFTPSVGCIYTVPVDDAFRNTHVDPHIKIEEVEATRQFETGSPAEIVHVPVYTSVATARKSVSAPPINDRTMVPRALVPTHVASTSSTHPPSLSRRNKFQPSRYHTPPSSSSRLRASITAPAVSASLGNHIASSSSTRTDTSTSANTRATPVPPADAHTTETLAECEGIEADALRHILLQMIADTTPEPRARYPPNAYPTSSPIPHADGAINSPASIKEEDRSTWMYPPSPSPERITHATHTLHPRYLYSASEIVPVTRTQMEGNMRGETLDADAGVTGASALNSPLDPRELLEMEYMRGALYTMEDSKRSTPGCIQGEAIESASVQEILTPAIISTATETHVAESSDASASRLPVLISVSSNPISSRTRASRRASEPISSRTRATSRSERSSPYPGPKSTSRSSERLASSSASAPASSNSTSAVSSRPRASTRASLDPSTGTRASTRAERSSPYSRPLLTSLFVTRSSRSSRAAKASARSASAPATSTAMPARVHLCRDEAGLWRRSESPSRKVISQ